MDNGERQVCGLVWGLEVGALRLQVGGGRGAVSGGRGGSGGGGGGGGSETCPARGSSIMLLEGPSIPT